MREIHNEKLIEVHRIERGEVLYPHQSTAVLVAFGRILLMIILLQPV